MNEWDVWEFNRTSVDSSDFLLFKAMAFNENTNDRCFHIKICVFFDRLNPFQYSPVHSWTIIQFPFSIFCCLSIQSGNSLHKTDLWEHIQVKYHYKILIT